MSTDEFALQYDRPTATWACIKVRAAFPETEDTAFKYLINRGGRVQPEATQQFHAHVGHLTANLRDFIVRIVRRPL